MRLARAVWLLLKERRDRWIAIGGTSGRKPEKSFTIGSSVNAAVAAFTPRLAHLGKEDGVQVNQSTRAWSRPSARRRIRAEVERSGEPEAKVREALCRETESCASARSRTWPIW